MAALNIAFRGSLEHRLRWSFKVYDKDGNGYVDRSELLEIVNVSALEVIFLTLIGCFAKHGKKQYHAIINILILIIIIFNP